MYSLFKHFQYRRDDDTAEEEKEEAEGEKEEEKDEKETKENDTFAML
jgi:hypothetical protein